MHILLTGGTGFFGKSFMRYWMKVFSNTEPLFQLTILSRNISLFKKNYPEFTNLNWIFFKSADILEPNSLKDGIKYTHIIHAAADSTNGYSVDPIYRFNQINIGTKNILEYSINNDIKKFLMISSGAIYGIQPIELNSIPENYTGGPNSLDTKSVYGLSKKMAENLCCLYSEKYGLEVVIARCFTFGGVDLPLNKHYALGNFINDVKCKRDIIIQGSGQTIRSYLHQNDLSKWLYYILLKGLDRNAYNIGSEKPITILELAEKIVKISKIERKIKILNLNSSKNSEIYIPDMKKFKSEIGVKQSYTIEDIIKDMLII